LEDFLFFSLYSFSCIANNSTTLKTFSNLVFVLVPRYVLRVQPSNIHITCARPRPLQGERAKGSVVIFAVVEGTIAAMGIVVVVSAALGAKGEGEARGEAGEVMEAGGIM
jgi:hypothetical protein